MNQQVKLWSGFSKISLKKNLTTMETSNIHSLTNITTMYTNSLNVTGLVKTLQ